MNIPGAVISAAVEEILEKMYFCQAQAAGPGSLKAAAIGAQVEVTGDIRCRFIVAASAALATRLAADFVAARVVEMTILQATEIVNEFTNVACSATMARWIPDAKLTFSVPRGLPENEIPAEWPWCFSVDGPHADLAVAIVADKP